MVEGDRRALAGVPAQVPGGLPYFGWICRERTCETATFLEEQREKVKGSAPRRAFGCGRSAPGRSLDSCARWFLHYYYRAVVIGSTTGNHVEYRVVPHQAVPFRKPHLMTPPASAGVQVLGVDASTYGITRTDAAGAPVSSPASWTTRGRIIPRPAWRDLVPGSLAPRHENWLEERAAKTSVQKGIMTLDPFQGYKTPLMTSSKTQPASRRFHIVVSRWRRLMRYAVVQQDTLGQRTQG